MLHDLDLAVPYTDGAITRPSSTSRSTPVGPLSNSAALPPPPYLPILYNLPTLYRPVQPIVRASPAAIALIRSCCSSHHTTIQSSPCLGCCANRFLCVSRQPLLLSSIPFAASKVRFLSLPARPGINMSRISPVPSVCSLLLSTLD